jgi:hypothetical protein
MEEILGICLREHEFEVFIWNGKGWSVENSIRRGRDMSIAIPIPFSIFDSPKSIQLNREKSTSSGANWCDAQSA